LLGPLQFVDPVKNFADPQNSEFAAQTTEIEEHSTEGIRRFGGKDTIFVVSPEVGSRYWP
jgi:hypothetical protein